MKKRNRMKKILLGFSGLAAYQFAGCDFLGQFSELIPGLPGVGG